MHLSKVPFSQTNAFTNFFLDYIYQNAKLEPFYGRYPNPDNFKPQIIEKQKSFPRKNREIVSVVLENQYQNIPLKDIVLDNIRSIREDNTFTVVTGHQLNICTGPLYFIYKIITVINTCRVLKDRYPDFNFVPVYWMASEDHDYNEIKHFRLLGRKYTWVTNQQGAVGRFSTGGLPHLMETLPGDVSLFTRAYQQGKSLSEAVRLYVNDLFGDQGLVVIDADDRQLKSLIRPVIGEDIMEHTPKKLVDNASSQLESLGYKIQVYCRAVNFFYLDDHLRNRIEPNGARFDVLDTTISFDESALVKAIEDTPEKFSPNVILRPLYQEMVLPNLAYTGGPAEVVYWLQLKDVFEHYHIPFPILLPRNFAMIIENHVQKKIGKTGLSIVDFFGAKNELFNQWIRAHSGKDLTVKKEAEIVRSQFEQLRIRSEEIDKTLGQHVAAAGKCTLDRIGKIEKKMIRAEKRVHREKLGQIEAVKDILFPNGGLQERTDNFLNFYPAHPEFLQMLLKNLDPFDFQFNVLTY